MDAKEIELRGKALTKAFVGGDPPSTLLGILGDLRTRVSATEELLRSTRIGVIVNKVKQHKDPEVARNAGELVSKWRVDVRKAGAGSSAAAKGSGNDKSATANGSARSPTGNGSGGGGGGGGGGVGVGENGSKTKTKSSVPPDQRSAKADKVDVNVTGNATRDNCLRLMYDGLALMTEESPDDVLRIARAVEQAAFAAYKPETSDTYKAKIRSLYQNLKNRSNPGLRLRVLSGEVTPEYFVVMSHEELKSAERRAEDAKLQKENMDKAMVAQEEKSISASLECGRCRQKKVSYSQAQTRSADEPLTTFCECQNCGHRWKFS